MITEIKYNPAASPDKLRAWADKANEAIVKLNAIEQWGIDNPVTAASSLPTVATALEALQTQLII